MPSKQFTQKVKNLTPNPVKAKEVVIGRVLNAHTGLAGTTPKWEAFFIDEDNQRSVALLDS